MFMQSKQDNGLMMGPLNVEHFRFDDADIAMVIPQQLASLQRGKAWKTHYRRHIAFFLLLGCLRTPLFPRPPFHQVCSLAINRDNHKLSFSTTSDLALLWGYYKGSLAGGGGVYTVDNKTLPPISVFLSANYFL